MIFQDSVIILLISGSKVKRNMQSEKTQTKCGVMFIRGMSGFQIFLGSCCIIIALAGLSGAFDTKYRITRYAMWDIQVCMGFCFLIMQLINSIKTCGLYFSSIEEIVLMRGQSSIIFVILISLLFMALINVV